MTYRNHDKTDDPRWLSPSEYSAFLLHQKRKAPLLTSQEFRDALEYLASQPQLDFTQLKSTLSQIVQVNEVPFKQKMLNSARYLSQVGFILKDKGLLPLEHAAAAADLHESKASDTRVYFLSTPIPERKLSKVQFVGALMQQRWPLIGLMLLIGSPALVLAAFAELLQQPLFDTFVPEGRIPSIVLVGVASIVFQMTGQVFSTIQTLFQAYFNENIELDTKVATVRRYLRARADSLPKRDVGNWRLTFSVASAFLGSIDSLLISIPLAIISMLANLLIVGAFTDFSAIWSLLLVLLIPTAISLGITYLSARISIRVMSQESTIDALIYGVVKQIRGIWLTNTEGVYVNRFSRARVAMSRNILSSGILDSSSLVISTLFQGFLYAFIFHQYYQSYIDTSRADLSVGSILVIYFAIGSLSGSLNSIAQDLVSVAQTLPTYWTPNAIRDISEFESLMSDEKTECPSRIEVCDITYTFAESYLPFETPLSFSLDAGKSYAIVGPSGSGKSTLINLLIGHFRPRTGSFRLLNHAGSQYADSMANCDLLVLTQDPSLCGSRLLDVVDPSRKYSLDLIESACSSLDLTSLLDSLPLRWDTPVNEFSRDLSLGQLQRFKIARALISSHDIIISDEVTCHLPEEQHIAAIQLLNDHCRLHLSVLHRLSALPLFDYVIQLDSLGQLNLITPDEYLS